MLAGPFAVQSAAFSFGGRLSDAAKVPKFPARKRSGHLLVVVSFPWTFVSQSQARKKGSLGPPQLFVQDTLFCSPLLFAMRVGFGPQRP